MQVNLIKKLVEFENKEGKKIKGYNYYLQCGSSLVPIRCSFVADLAVLRAFADLKESN